MNLYLLRPHQFVLLFVNDYECFGTAIVAQQSNTSQNCSVYSLLSKKSCEDKIARGASGDKDTEMLRPANEYTEAFRKVTSANYNYQKHFLWFFLFLFLWFFYLLFFHLLFVSHFYKDTCIRALFGNVVL